MDQHEARRALTGFLLGSLGNDQARKTAAALLKDGSAVVRLRVAQGLLAGDDPTGLAALIDLVKDSELPLGWQAEELLRYAAGKNSPPTLIGSGGVEQRQRCAREWAAWWARHGERIDAPQLKRQLTKPGLLLVCGYDSLRFPR